MGSKFFLILLACLVSGRTKDIISRPSSVNEYFRRQWLTKNRIFLFIRILIIYKFNYFILPFSKYWSVAILIHSERFSTFLLFWFPTIWSTIDIFYYYYLTDLIKSGGLSLLFFYSMAPSIILLITNCCMTKHVFDSSFGRSFFLLRFL